MGWYERNLLPRVLCWACSAPEIMEVRQRLVPLAIGRVLELGVGGGLNLAFYRPDALHELHGLDPSPGPGDVHGGFSTETKGAAWSPDSKWLAYPLGMANHLHTLNLYELATGRSTPITNPMADASDPAFDRNGKWLYFLASNNAGATGYFLDMTSDLYSPTRSIYALSLKADTLSPVAPEAEDEKSPAETKAKSKEESDSTPAGQAGQEKAAAKARPGAPTTPPKPTPVTEIDLAGLPLDQIAVRTVSMSLPPRSYESLQSGKPGVFYYLERQPVPAFFDNEDGAELHRYVIEDRKSEKLADRVASYQITADGEKMLVAQLPPKPPGGAPTPPGGRKPSYVIASAITALKPGEGALSVSGLEVRVDPAAEWKQMFHEVWRIQRAYFYDPGFHGVDTVAEEKMLEPYVASLQSRADLNYVFQEMLTGFSVGHLRGFGGAIPTARKVPGGLLGADYSVKGDRWCLAKIYTGGAWSPTLKAPLAQPGLNVKAGDCITAINGQALAAKEDIQAALEGTSGKAITLSLQTGAGSRDVTVIPVASEAQLRNTDWIDTNQRKVSEMSGGKLAYVYLPDTGQGGFTNFNRYFFAQTDRQGVIIDERFNGGGQVADYIVEVLGRKLISYWSPRYGALDRSPSAAILGPKVMIANEWSGSGGDALPWMFKQAKIGPFVGKRTWGGLVGISGIPILMDDGEVTSPSVAFFSPQGQWDVENHGVDPDYPVEQDAAHVAAGGDPQLEAAVALAMDALRKTPEPSVRRPDFPSYARPPSQR